VRSLLFRDLWLALLVCAAFTFSGWTRVSLQEVPVSQLPPEAVRTLALIKQGGPFPYRKDGTVFRNRERLLPLMESGYYREYTVPTPGAKDRGARRIVSGSQAEYYYTEDHYRSFRRIRE
jgi:ribonuclease T1